MANKFIVIEGATVAQVHAAIDNAPAVTENTSVPAWWNAQVRQDPLRFITFGHNVKGQTVAILHPCRDDAEDAQQFVGVLTRRLAQCGLTNITLHV